MHDDRPRIDAQDGYISACGASRKTQSSSKLCCQRLLELRTLDGVERHVQRQQSSLRLARAQPDARRSVAPANSATVSFTATVGNPVTAGAAAVVSSTLLACMHVVLSLCLSVATPFAPHHCALIQHQPRIFDSVTSRTPRTIPTAAERAFHERD